MSQEKNPTDRMVRLYFGRPGEMNPSKEEVGEFIKSKMASSVRAESIDGARDFVN
ncbi:hypothetical protein [Halorhabdus salina]|uniref:hypothetical protein n=1 Tax=Halorhabdus salina TaxID=2750670 RepID=UPI0015EE89AF|nr:hypothetical protein [Halorhabdus salina]